MKIGVLVYADSQTLCYTIIIINYLPKLIHTLENFRDKE